MRFLYLQVRRGTDVTENRDSRRCDSSARRLVYWGLFLSLSSVRQIQMANTTQLSLLERVCRSPDDPGWHEFVAVYSPYIERYLRRLGVRETDIADIRQEVMQVVVRELPSFDHNRRKGAFRAWLPSRSALQRGATTCGGPKWHFIRARTGHFIRVSSWGNWSLGRTRNGRVATLIGRTKCAGPLFRAQEQRALGDCVYFSPSFSMTSRNSLWLLRQNLGARIFVELDFG